MSSFAQKIMTEQNVNVFVKHNAPDNGQFQRRPRSQRLTHYSKVIRKIKNFKKEVKLSGQGH